MQNSRARNRYQNILYVSQPYMKVTRSLVKKLKIRSLSHSSDLLYQKISPGEELGILNFKISLGEFIRQFCNSFFSFMSSS